MAHANIDDAPACGVCGGASTLLGAVDFNKSCEESKGAFLAPSGIPVQYALCGTCGFCFAPELHAWTLREFEEKIYNDGYVAVDPDYTGARARTNASSLTGMFAQRAGSFRHIDYGGGDGLLSRLLGESHWRSSSYDPFVDKNTSVAQLGKFDLITAFEVFEHVPDTVALMSNLSALLAPGGLILFTTLLSDGNIHPGQKPDWWYAAPRNGHISLYSRNSLAILARRQGLKFGSFSPVFHVFYTDIPDWAGHIIKTA